MACKGCAKRREIAKQAVSKIYARANVLRARVTAKKAKTDAK